MTILALEFSSAQRSVALARGSELLAEAVETSGGRGTHAFGLIQKVLTQAGLARQDIEVLAIGLGPGSYTGIRAAIAVAQGWQLARGVRLLGCGSLDSLAARAQAEKYHGQVNLVVDAQRGEYYLAGWEISPQGRQEIVPLKIVPGAEIAARQAAGEICLGPEMPRRLFPSAGELALLAAKHTDYMPGERLEPIYLRENSFVKAPIPRLV